MAGRHRRAKRPSPVDSSSVGYGTQGVDSWSQPLQNAGNDDRTSYPNAWINDVQRPNETPSTHWGWDRERTERPLYLSVSGEQYATNAQPGGYRPVMQQAMHSHYAEKIIDSGLLPDTRTQHRVGTSNTVEAQRHWNGQNDTQDGESSFESTRNDTSRLEPWPHSQHAIGNPLQGHERDPNFSSSSGFTTGHRPMHDADRSHELLGMSPMLTTQDFGCLGNGGIEFPLNGIDGTQTGANPEPWSFYQPPDMSHLPQQDDRNQNSYLGSISDATLSSFRSDNLESGRQAPNGPQSYITSYDTLNDGMSENIPAQHPGPLYPRIPREGVPNRGPRNPLFTSPIFVFRPATPPIAPSRGALYRSVSDTESSIPGHGLLSPRPESMTSDTHSCVSDTSSPAASSEIYCDVDDCCTAFSGVHRKGNLARHKRLKHSGRVYVCENASCERVFNRQDARLKHYRKYHQQLARPYIARPQTRHANREQYSDFMSNASG